MKKQTKSTGTESTRTKKPAVFTGNARSAREAMRKTAVQSRELLTEIKKILRDDQALNEKIEENAKLPEVELEDFVEQMRKAHVEPKVDLASIAEEQEYCRAEQADNEQNVSGHVDISS